MERITAVTAETMDVVIIPVVNGAQDCFAIIHNVDYNQ